MQDLWDVVCLALDILSHYDIKCEFVFGVSTGGSKMCMAGNACSLNLILM